MDTVVLVFNICKGVVSSKILATLPVPHSKSNKGKGGSREYVVSDTAKSPLTGAEFKVKPIRAENGESILDIAGYKISVSIPACTIGNNLVLVNDVASAFLLALLLLQYWLLDNGCHPDALKVFSLDNAEVHGLTPTYFKQFESNAKANAAKWELFNHAEAIHNYALRTVPKYTDKARRDGGTPNGTWYIDAKYYLLRAYNKNGRLADSALVFNGPDRAAIEAAMFDEARLHLRLEPQLSREWLKNNGFGTPADCTQRADELYSKAFDLFKQELRYDFKFRQRKPKECDMPEPGSVDRILADYYFAGNDVRQHPRIQGKYGSDKDALNKYFSAANLRIGEKLHIDYTIPWEVHQKLISYNVKYLLNIQPYVPPAALAAHVFGPHTAPALIAKLQDVIEKRSKHVRKVHALRKNGPSALDKKASWSAENEILSNLME